MTAAPRYRLDSAAQALGARVLAGLRRSAEAPTDRGMEPALETIREALELAQKQRRALRHMMSRGAHCPGDEVELGVWKGCDQKLDGDTTCEMHGEDGDAVLDDAMRMLHLVDEQLNGLTREVGRLAEAQEVRH